MIAIAALSGAYRLIHADTVPAAEIELSMLLLGLALPMQAISASYRGVNEAYLNFKSISVLRIFLGAANFGAPFLVALYTKEVHWLVATLVLSRSRVKLKSLYPTIYNWPATRHLALPVCELL